MISQWENEQNASCSEHTHQIKMTIHSVACAHGQPLMSWVLLLVRGHPERSFEVSIGHKRFLTIILYILKIERRDWRHCVCLVEMQRKMHHDTPRSWYPCDLDLRSNFQLDLSRSSCICFEPTWRKKHYADNIISLACWRISYCQVYFGKIGYFDLMTSGA